VLLALGILIPPRDDIEVPFRIRCGTGALENDYFAQGAR
jgi:hypothetical protein